MFIIKRFPRFPTHSVVDDSSGSVSIFNRTAAPLAFLLTLFLHLTSSLTVARPMSACVNLPIPKVPGAKVLSITGVQTYGVINPPLPPFSLDTVTGLDVCNVTVFLSHPGVNDRVLVQLQLPISTWNGRFQATGGGDWATSFGEVQLSRAAAANYAASWTDGGHVDEFYNPSTWVLPRWFYEYGSFDQLRLTELARYGNRGESGD